MLDKISNLFLFLTVFVKAWLVSNILSQKLRKTVTIFLIISGIFLSIGMLARVLIQRKKSHNKK